MPKAAAASNQKPRAGRKQGSSPSVTDSSKAGQMPLDFDSIAKSVWFTVFQFVGLVTPAWLHHFPLIGLQITAFDGLQYAASVIQNSVRLTHRKPKLKTKNWYYTHLLTQRQDAS
ncbi:MAG: hypothetical protein IGS54_22615 [Elainella sp. C42_A2020_010]|nr:hypothetical protein [Elainella sp. C42_A2020_010]RNJ67203.1 MAG: hypothetical protein EDM05_21695 [Leptolyngbya sp. IPPAS B-1204]